MNFTAFVLFAFAVTFSKICVEATKCKPLSTFKIDCDECRCSDDGTEYSCSAKPCWSSSIRDADDRDSYVLDNPSSPDSSNENIEFAYLNDAAASSSENDDDSSFDDDDDYWDSEESSKETASTEEWDTGLPDDYRRKRRVQGKRYVRPHGKRYVKPLLR